MIIRLLLLLTASTTLLPSYCATAYCLAAATAFLLLCNTAAASYCCHYNSSFLPATAATAAHCNNSAIAPLLALLKPCWPAGCKPCWLPAVGLKHGCMLPCWPLQHLPAARHHCWLLLATAGSLKFPANCSLLVDLSGTWVSFNAHRSQGLWNCVSSGCSSR
jgi:hypothetical protein